MKVIADDVSADAARESWQKAVAAPAWHQAPTWLHGDLLPRIVRGRRCSGFWIPLVTDGGEDGERRQLLPPAPRVHGKRAYGRPELRRLAFIQIAQRLGIRLDTAAAVLDEPSAQWRATVGEQIAELEDLIARAQGAKDFLTHALMCPAEHPARECPYMMDTPTA